MCTITDIGSKCLVIIMWAEHACVSEYIALKVISDPFTVLYTYFWNIPFMVQCLQRHPKCRTNAWPQKYTNSEAQKQCIPS